MNIQKCAIVGCGAVGATAAYTLLGSGLFNELVLIDINQKKAEGEAMDIGHGVPFIHPVEIYAGTYEDLADAYLVIVTAGANQLPGESRINLTEKNVRIFQSIIPEIVRYNTECLLLIVANPVDILTTVALRLSGFPPERVIGSGTVLDSSRFKYRLGEYIGIDHRNVHAFIIGEHGDSEVAVWSSATVSGIAVRDFCDELGIVFTREQMDEIVRDVKNSAYEIIEKKGATFYAVAILCCVLTNFMSNTATTALMVPICLSIAQGMGADPRAVLMACVIGGSCAYATPIGMPANTMVIGAGGYTFMDYVKAGTPMIVIATIVSMIILPIAFPFFP